MVHGAPLGSHGVPMGSPGTPLGIPFAAVLTHGSRFCRSLHSCQHHCLHGVTFIFILRHLLSLPPNMLCALVIFTSLRPRRSTNRNILKLQNRKVRVTIYMWNVPKQHPGPPNFNNFDGSALKAHSKIVLWLPDRAGATLSAIPMRQHWKRTAKLYFGFGMDNPFGTLVMSKLRYLSKTEGWDRAGVTLSAISMSQRWNTHTHSKIELWLQDGQPYR